jgi:tyrosinase
MGVRRNIYSLSATERQNWITAVLRLKANGTYDEFVRRHQTAMMTPTVSPGEAFTQRNAAHMGPVFLPWHRRELRDFEQALEAEVSGVTLPYWDWATDGALANPRSAQLWTADFLGGDGDPANGDRVMNGPFRDWRALITGANGTFVTRSTPGIIRRLGRDPNGAPTLPRPPHVAATKSETAYDSAPWSEASGAQPGPGGSVVPSFRNRIEGWLTRVGDPAGPGMHNRVHTWVGGDMLFGTSPNDPVFFLNHANIDRLWAEWQETTGIGYLPTSGGPPGHNLNDALRFLNAPGAGMPPLTPAGSLDFRALGYTYDTLPDGGGGQEPPDGGNGEAPVELAVGGPAVAASIGQPGETDRFRFTAATAGATYVIETQGPTDIVMSLYGPNSEAPGALVTEDDDSGQDTNARIQSALSAGAYIVHVRHFRATQTGSYQISVRALNGGGGGGGGTPSPTVPELTVGGPAVSGSIAAANESDLYHFRAATAGTYIIETGGTTDTFITLFGPNSQTAQLAVDDDSGPATNSLIQASLAIGDYYVRVRHFSPTGTGAYTISVRR